MPSLHAQYSPLSQLVPSPSSHYLSPEMPSPCTQGRISQQSTSQRPSVETPFWVTLLFGNVSRCNGCKGKIARGPDNKPPDNLVLGHKEFVIFSNPKTGRFEQSWEKRNVYYHQWKNCVAPNFADLL
jgi:hypothetical protein